MTDAILAATVEEVLEFGYHGVRIERIAARAGCGKSTIYRRWPEKGDVVAAAVDHASEVGTIPDTGSLVEDLVEHAGWNIRNQSARSGHNALFSALAAPEVRTHLWDNGFLKVRRDMGRAIFARAIARGEAPDDVDADVVLDTIAGIVLYRNTVRPVGVSLDEIRALAQALVATPPLRN